MNAKRIAELMRRRAELDLELAREFEQLADSEWVDQQQSPLGRRRHCALARTGQVTSRKVGRRVLIRKIDIDAVLEREGKPPADEDEDERMLREIGARKRVA
jgi:hypothetical protein